MDLITISEEQAKQLEDLGMPVYVAYAVDRKAMETISAILGAKPSRKKTKAQKAQPAYRFRRVKGALDAMQGTKRHEAHLALDKANINIGDEFTRAEAYKAFDGKFKKSHRSSVLQELYRTLDVIKL